MAYKKKCKKGSVTYNEITFPRTNGSTLVWDNRVNKAYCASWLWSWPYMMFIREVNSGRFNTAEHTEIMVMVCKKCHSTFHASNPAPIFCKYEDCDGKLTMRPLRNIIKK